MKPNNIELLLDELLDVGPTPYTKICEMWEKCGDPNNINCLQQPSPNKINNWGKIQSIQTDINTPEKHNKYKDQNDFQLQIKSNPTAIKKDSHIGICSHSDDMIKDNIFNDSNIKSPSKKNSSQNIESVLSDPMHSQKIFVTIPVDEDQSQLSELNCTIKKNLIHSERCLKNDAFDIFNSPGNSDSPNYDDSQRIINNSSSNNAVSSFFSNSKKHSDESIMTQKKQRKKVSQLEQPVVNLTSLLQNEDELINSNDKEANINKEPSIQSSHSKIKKSSSNFSEWFLNGPSKSNFTEMFINAPSNKVSSDEMKSKKVTENKLPFSDKNSDQTHLDRKDSMEAPFKKMNKILENQEQVKIDKTTGQVQVRRRSLSDGNIKIPKDLIPLPTIIEESHADGMNNDRANDVYHSQEYIFCDKRDTNNGLIVSDKKKQRETLDSRKPRDNTGTINNTQDGSKCLEYCDNPKESVKQSQLSLDKKNNSIENGKFYSYGKISYISSINNSGSELPSHKKISKNSISKI